jgi:hypothetical protein
MFNKLNAKEAGSKGGKAKTKRKGKAARVNGDLGGRPATRTLAERLLGHRIYPEQQKYIERAFSDMVSGERSQLEKYFHLKKGVLEDYFADGTVMFATLNSADWKTKSRRVPKEIRYLIKKFRLAANYYLRPVPKPKPYCTEYERRPDREQEWERWHPGIPCPPMKRTVDVRRLPHFEFIEAKYKKGVVFTLEDLTEVSGQWTRKRAEVALKWLDATYSRTES